MVKFDPQYELIIFGNGAQARAMRIIKDDPGEDGRIETEFHLEPTPEMKLYHDLDDKYRNHEGYIVARFLSSDVVPLNSDPVMKSSLIRCDFDYGDTPFTRPYPNPQILKGYIRENRILRGIVAKLEYEKLKALKRLNKITEEDVILIQTLRKAGRDLYERGLVPTEEDTT